MDDNKPVDERVILVDLTGFISEGRARALTLWGKPPPIREASIFARALSADQARLSSGLAEGAAATSDDMVRLAGC